jgi:hypothetical protein
MHSTACDLRVRTANHAPNYTLGSPTILVLILLALEPYIHL